MDFVLYLISLTVGMILGVVMCIYVDQVHSNKS